MYSISSRMTLPSNPFSERSGSARRSRQLRRCSRLLGRQYMDLPDVGPGAIVYFPVHHKSAYLYLGDCHVTEGDHGPPRAWRINPWRPRGL